MLLVTWNTDSLNQRSAHRFLPKNLKAINSNWNLGGYTDTENTLHTRVKSQTFLCVNADKFQFVTSSANG